LLVSATTSKHFQSSFCIEHSTHSQQHVQEEIPSTLDTLPPFHIGDQSIDFVSTYTYLGRVLSCDDSDDQAAYARLQKAATVWGRFKVLLQKDGASVSTMGRFYRTIIMQTLLFGSDTWTLSARSLSRLERFHARCARGIAHCPIQRLADDTWNCPPTDEVLAACHLVPLDTYILHRRRTLFRHYAADHSAVYQKCLAMQETPRFIAWWKLNMT
jgi:hypothetical protein